MPSRCRKTEGRAAPRAGRGMHPVVGRAVRADCCDAGSVNVAPRGRLRPHANVTARSTRKCYRARPKYPKRRKSLRRSEGAASGLHAVRGSMHALQLLAVSAVRLVPSPGGPTTASQPLIARCEFTLPYGLFPSIGPASIQIRENHADIHRHARLLGRSVAVLGLCATVHAGDLSVVGTGDGIDLLRALGAAYTADHPETNVIVPPSIGSGGGIAAVGSDKEVLARIARPLSDSEKEAGLIATPVFRLPSAFFVHRSAGVSGLTNAQLADIYRGKITNWREVGGADLRIKVVRREDQDSTLLVLRQSMPGWKELRDHRQIQDRGDHAGLHRHREGSAGRDRLRAVHPGARDGARGAQDRRPPSDRSRLSERRDLVVRAQGSDRDARRPAFHRLCQGRQGAHGPDADGGRSGRRSDGDTVRTRAEGQGLAPPFFAQQPADHRGRCDRDDRVRGLVRPDHRPARSGPQAAGGAARSPLGGKARPAPRRRSAPCRRAPRRAVREHRGAARKHRAARRRREGAVLGQCRRHQRAARPRRAGRRYRRHPGGRHQAARVRRRERQGRHRGGEPRAARQSVRAGSPDHPRGQRPQAPAGRAPHAWR